MSNRFEGRKPAYERLVKQRKYKRAKPKTLADCKGGTPSRWPEPLPFRYEFAECLVRWIALIQSTLH